MRDLSNCLNALLVLLCLPIYLLGMLAGLIGFALQQVAPHWLPAWAQPISFALFLGFAMDLVVWYVVVPIIQGARLSGPPTDFTAIEAIPLMFEEASCYLLAIGIAVRAVVLKLL